jgi:hypothetical protein
MWCWGLNTTGQLGDSSTTLRRSGIAVWPHGVRLQPIGTDLSARVIIAGDIACNAIRRTTYGVGPSGVQCGEQSTATLISSLSPDGVVALGDLQYEAASISDLNNFFGSTWGAFKNIIYPVNTSPVVLLDTWSTSRKLRRRTGQPMQAVGELLRLIHGARGSCMPDALRLHLKQRG